MSLSLIKNDDDVTVISTHEKKDNLKDFKKIIFHKAVLRKSGAFKYLQFYSQVNNILKNNLFDTIICGDLYSLASIAKYKKTAQIIFDSREIYSDLYAHKNKPWLRFFCSTYENYFLRYVNQVLVTAETDNQYLQKKYKHHKHLTWSVVYNYPKFFTLNQTKKRDHKNINIIYQGVLQKGRGIKKLIEFVNFTKQYTATIIGGGEEKEHYISLVKKLNIQNKIIFTDMIPYLKLHKYTIRGDLGWALIDYSNLSNSYALPNKVFEYALMGLPVVASNIHNIKQIVNKYKIGKIITDETNNMLEKQITELMRHKRNPLFYHNIIKNNFCWDVQNDKFIKLIHNQ